MTITRVARKTRKPLTPAGTERPEESIGIRRVRGSDDAPEILASCCCRVDRSRRYTSVIILAPDPRFLARGGLREIIV